MAKLSRKDKYKDLRAEIDQQAEQSIPKNPAPLDKSIRLAAPDRKAELKKEMSGSAGPVIENVLDEVSRYNLENGDIVSEDPQLQILHELNSASQNGSRRSAHLETMETNEQAGGTTRNIYGSDISAIPSNTVIESSVSETIEQPAAGEEPPAAVSELLSGYQNGTEIDAAEFVRLFESSSDASRPEEEGDTLEVPAPAQVSVEESGDLKDEDDSHGGFRLNSLFGRRKKDHRKAKESIEKPAELVDEEEDLELEVPAKPEPLIEETTATKQPDITVEDKAETAKEQPAKAPGLPDAKEEKPARSTRSQEQPPANKAATVFMVVCCVVLVIAIVLVIYWMSSLGIF